MYNDKFFSNLNEDILGLGNIPAPHHRVTIRGIDRKNPNQIPDIHKAESHPTENKILMIKKNGGSCGCNNNDVQYITNKFKLNNIDKPRNLGKTGVTLVKTQHGNFILTK